MGTIAINMIKQLNEDEANQVIDYIQFLLHKRNDNSLSEGYEVFMSMREDAKNNGVSGMSMDEINAEIKKMHEGKSNYSYTRWIYKNSRDNK